MEREISGDDEPLLEGLAHLPAGSIQPLAPPAALREAVYRKTRAVIRGRRRRRRAFVALCLGVVYAAGLATPWRAARKESAPPAVLDEPQATSLTRAAKDPGELLRQVIDAPPAERPRLLREAGDAYLAAEGDVEGALHCYRQLLELSDASARIRPESGDTWLLGSLKAAHQAEPRR